MNGDTQLKDFWPWRAVIAWSDPGDGAYKECLVPEAVPSCTAWACTAMVRLVNSSPQLISGMEMDQVLWAPFPGSDGFIEIRGQEEAVRQLVMHAGGREEWSVISPPAEASRVKQEIVFKVTLEPLEAGGVVTSRQAEEFRSWLDGKLAEQDGSYRVGLE